MRARSLLILLALGCGSVKEPPSLAQRPLWYSIRAVWDMTGGGGSDTLLLEARGRRPDSLAMTFVIRGEGRVLFRDEYRDWLDATPSSHASLDSLAQRVRRDMDAFFAAKNFESAATLPFEERWPPVSTDCDGDPRNCVSFWVRYEREVAMRVKQGHDSTPASGQSIRSRVVRYDICSADRRGDAARWVAGIHVFIWLRENPNDHVESTGSPVLPRL